MAVQDQWERITIDQTQGRGYPCHFDGSPAVCEVTRTSYISGGTYTDKYCRACMLKWQAGQDALIALGKMAPVEVVPLIRDCECTTHVGPHWLHMLDINKQALIHLLKADNVPGFMAERANSLANQHYAMKLWGMSDTDTVKGYMIKLGYDPEVIEECNNLYSSRQAELVAELDRLMGPDQSMGKNGV